MKQLKYNGYSVVMQEVPGEISLAINISGCPHKCEGCHSKYLWEYTGNYLLQDIEVLLQQYADLITCVCFMGGDQNQEELLSCINIVKKYNLKTCLYSGLNRLDDINKQIIKRLNYIKIGRYDENLGGLNESTTNQRMFDLSNNKELFFYKRRKG